MSGALAERSLTAINNDSPVILLGMPGGNKAGDGTFTLQGVQAKSTRNRAPRGVGTLATPVGSVVYDTTHIEGVAGSAYLNTDLIEVETFCGFLTFATDATFSGTANQPNMAGNWQSSNGWSLFAIDSTGAPTCRLRLNMYTSGNNLATLVIANAAAYTTIYFRVSATLCRIDDLTHATNAVSAAPSGSRVTVPSRLIRILSAYSGSFGGGCKVPWFSYFPNRHFTLDEANVIYNRKIKPYLAQPVFAIAA
ncbi:hypothetical protein ACSBOB_01505 [Mesorhizobium sp. ASY16-5R]|uniref:hypothetical protein n=1 Tax=Mesorhizobium sp. ASY16-5R TaxID=3445772 RepID=UPI003FA0A4DD